MDEVEYKLKKRNAVLAVNVSISNVTQSFYQAVKKHFIYCTSILLHMQHWTCPTMYYKITIHVQSLKTVINIK
jgi:hypothetical protein